MKHIGSHFEYEDARNADLIRAYYHQLSLHNNVVTDALFADIVEMPSERFWVSEERAVIVMTHMLRGEKFERMRPKTREKYNEIFRRVMLEREKRPNESLYNLTFDVVNSPAPKFYLTPGSARVIINKIRKQWYEKRKLKYRHLFM